MTYNLSLRRKRNFGKKIDRFVWRIQNRMISLVDNLGIEQLNIQLAILSDYMQSCPTRVMASQVFDVCMETLLRVKVFPFSSHVSNLSSRVVSLGTVTCHFPRPSIPFSE